MNNVRLIAFILLGTTIALLSNCKNDKKSSEKDKLPAKNTDFSYEELGLKYASTTKGMLGKNLITAISTNGTEKALEFCNEKAYQLTDSVAIALNTSIKRVSDNPRNPKNAASEIELEHIAAYKKKLESGEKAEPMMQEIGNKMVAYYPITTNQMCLQCHGKPNTNITPAVLNKINQLYPEDRAIGYDVNQLRGLLVIEMDKKTLNTEL